MRKIVLLLGTMRWYTIPILLALNLIAFYPIFFVVFRMSVFSTVPTDDYAPFLLWVLGQPGGEFPASPYCYRILSMFAAAPFYYILPGIDLTNIPKSLPATWVKATAALSALAYMSMICSMLAMTALAVRKCGLTLRDGLLAGLLLLMLIFYTGITAIDPFAVLIVCVALLVLDRPWAFGVVALAAAGINEKVGLVLAIWLTVRWVLVRADRARLTVPWLFSLAGVALHLALVLWLRFPGHEYQLRPSGFLGTIIDNLQAYLSARGLLLNILPALVLAAIGSLGYLASHSSRVRHMFRSVDLLTIPGMMGVALVFTQQFQAGRLLMHAAPLFVLPFIAGLPTLGGTQDTELVGGDTGLRGT